MIFNGQWIGFREACKKTENPIYFLGKVMVSSRFHHLSLKKVSSYMFQQIFPSNHPLKWSTVRFGAKVLGFDKGCQAWRTEGAFYIKDLFTITKSDNINDGIFMYFPHVFRWFIDGSCIHILFSTLMTDGLTTSIYAMNKCNQI